MSTFVAQRVTRSHTIQLPTLPQQVFPLFEPLGEKLWEADWNPDMLYPLTGIAGVGTTFTTRHVDEPTKIWTIVAYEQVQSHVTYFNVLPHSHTTWIDVRCQQAEEQTSRVCVTYTLTALTPQGNAVLAAFTQQYYQTWISSWQQAITYYLLHGQLLPHNQG